MLGLFFRSPVRLFAEQINEATRHSGQSIHRRRPTRRWRRLQPRRRASGHEAAANAAHCSRLSLMMLIGGLGWTFTAVAPGQAAVLPPPMCRPVPAGSLAQLRQRFAAWCQKTERTRRAPPSPRTAMPPFKKLWAEDMGARFPTGTFKRIESVLRAGEACERRSSGKLARREKKLRKA
jgi:hypothetical protein